MYAQGGKRRGNVNGQGRGVAGEARGGGACMYRDKAQGQVTLQVHKTLCIADRKKTHIANFSNVKSAWQTVTHL